MLQQELDSLLPSRDLSRRGFVKTAVGSGFAAAVLPVTAQTIKTDSEGLTVGEVTIPVGDFKMPAYSARPAGKTGLPVILVVSEIFGVHEHIADIARRFAKLGYLAIAPELFVRQGDAQSYGEIAKLVSEVIAKTPDAQVMGDLDASVAWCSVARSSAGVTGLPASLGTCKSFQTGSAANAATRAAGSSTPPATRWSARPAPSGSPAAPR